ncbi:MAG: DUF1015 family protein [Bacteroidetes bacterium]|nr:DUF1015 family protein [Bacteroidota bacterium]
MTLIRPFKGWIASSDYCQRVPIKHIDSYGAEGIQRELSNNEHSFLHVLAPSITVNEELDLNERFSLVRERLVDQLCSGVYRQIDQESLWIYKIQSQRVNATGIVGITPIAAYLQNTIKRHEKTKTSRRNTLATYLEEVGIHADPVVLSFSNYQKEFKSWCTEITSSQQPQVRLTVEDELHQLWPLTDSSQIKKMQKMIESNDSVYIVDGHHRIESSLYYAKSKKHPEIAIDESYFLSFFIAEEDLSIQSNPNRHRTALNLEQGIKYIEQRAALSAIDALSTCEQHALIINETTFAVSLKKPTTITDFERHLEEMPKRTEKMGLRTRLTFVPKAYTVDDLKHAAESKHPMSAKSTYIEPKLLTGLLIYPIS